MTSFCVCVFVYALLFMSQIFCASTVCVSVLCVYEIICISIVSVSDFLYQYCLCRYSTTKMVQLY